MLRIVYHYRGPIADNVLLDSLRPYPSKKLHEIILASDRRDRIREIERALFLIK